MSDALGEAFVDIRARFDKLDKDLNGVRARLDSDTRKMSRSFDGVNRAVDGLKTRLAALGIAGVVTGFAHLIKRAADTADKLDKLAGQAGISVERLQSLRFAAEQTGAGADFFSQGLTRLNRRLGEFINSGAGPAAKAFEELGLAADIQSGKLSGTEQVFDAVIDKLGEYQDSSRQAALAAQLFGDDAGPKMSLMLSQGAEGMRNLEERARELGIVLSQDAVKAAVELRDKWTEVMAVMTAKFNNFALTFLQGMDAIFNITTGEKLRERVDELRSIQDTLSRRSQGTGFENFLAGPTDNLERRQGELLEEIRILDQLENARLRTRSALESGVGTGGGGGGGGGGGRGGGGGGTAAAAQEVNAYAEILDEARRRLDELIIAQGMVGASDDEMVAHTERVRLLDQVYREFGNTAEEINAAIAAGLLPENYVEQIHEMADALAEATDQLRQTEEATKDAAAAAKTMSDETSRMAVNAFEAALRGESLKEVLLGVGLSILDMTATENALESFFNTLFQGFSMQPAANAGGTVGTGGGLLGGLFTSIFSGLGGLLGFASGGNPPVGKFSLVGEQGPELVKFNSPSTVYSTRDTANMLSNIGEGSAPSQTIHMTVVTPDAQSFRRSQPQIMADMASAGRRANRRDA